MRIHRHGLVDSTSERAFEALQRGEALHWDVHVASGQSAGRGRRGRAWESAEGEGLYMSAVLAAPTPSPSPAGWSLAAGLAVRDTVTSLGLGSSRLKWPNDLLIGEAKLAGTLVEGRGLGEEAHWFVLGIGLNVRQREFPRDLTEERPVTSLLLEGIDVQPDEILDPLILALASRLDGLESDPEALSADFLEALGCRERQVRVRHGTEALEGFLLALSLAGGALVKTAKGPRRLRLEHIAALELLP